jgi:hypothetical protein
VPLGAKYPLVQSTPGGEVPLGTESLDYSTSQAPGIRQHQVQRLGRMAQQLGQQVVHRQLADAVVVVQHQDEGLFDLVQFVGQAPGNNRERGQGRSMQQSLRFPASVGEYGLDGGPGALDRSHASSQVLTRVVLP